MELLAPIFMPFLFMVMYAPIEDTYIIQRLGCCCSNPGFNTNDFNTIVYVLCGMFVSICAIVWSRSLPWRTRAVYLAIAIPLVGAAIFFLRLPSWR